MLCSGGFYRIFIQTSGETEFIMSKISVEPISDSVKLNAFTDPRFKTMGLSVNLVLPLEKMTAAQRGILPSLVCRATRQYPDYTALSRRLAELYGAGLRSGVRKIGEYQVLQLSVSGISSRYAFGGEDMLEELSQLLFSVIFDPLRGADGEFPLEGFQQEKRQLLELKDAEFNDKVSYARHRCEELLFQGTRAGIDRYGSREDVAALEPGGLYDAWRQVLENARFEIFAMGDCQPEVAMFRERFQGLGKPHALGRVPYEKPDQVLMVTEEQPVSQGKLSLAFLADVPPQERMLFQLMSAVLGGTASSKLFLNVREKMGLCYYCSSSFLWASGALYIDSGVEPGNMDRAEDAILAQLDAMQQGRVTEEELLHAKLALKTSLGSMNDSLQEMENWYLGRTFDNPGLAPEEAAQTLMSYRVEDVVEAARRLEPAVAYRLKGGAA